MNSATSFCEKIEKGVHYHHLKAVGPKSPHDGNLALLECRSALQKCRIGSWRSNALPCSGAIWSLLLGFFGWSLYLDVFSTSVYDFLSLFWIIQAFLRTIILNNVKDRFFGPRGITSLATYATSTYY